MLASAVLCSSTNHTGQTSFSYKLSWNRGPGTWASGCRDRWLADGLTYAAISVGSRPLNEATVRLSEPSAGAHSSGCLKLRSLHTMDSHFSLPATISLRPFAVIFCCYSGSSHAWFNQAAGWACHPAPKNCLLDPSKAGHGGTST
jgi:hypothetical protein